MPKARKEQISLSDTPYYHCISRCVRRAFLCGSDPFSGKDYQHRKQWMVERLTHLAQVFAIEIFAYSLMYKAFVNSTQKNGSEVSTYSDPNYLIPIIRFLISLNCKKKIKFCLWIQFLKQLSVRH